MSSWNRRAKGWGGWLLLAVVVAGALAVGIARDSGPRTPEERVASITRRLACPICDGESVYDSRNPASNNIRDAVQLAVAEGQLADDEIIERIVLAYDGEELLVPTTDGFEALAWALPAAAFVLAVAGLTVAFRRWQESSRALGQATAEDYALVAAAAAQDDLTDGDASDDRS